MIRPGNDHVPWRLPRLRLSRTDLTPQPPWCPPSVGMLGTHENARQSVPMTSLCLSSHVTDLAACQPDTPPRSSKRSPRIVLLCAAHTHSRPTRP
jgi:hypothetical protein